MKLSLWTRYNRLGASSRLRFMQFVPYLQNAGWETELFTFLDDDYLRKLYAGKKPPVTGVFNAYCRRCRDMLKLPAEIPALIEYELLPYWPFFMEKGFLKKHPYILNFDDAVDLRYSKIPVLKNKYPQLLTNAAGIITANDLLQQKFAPYNSNILKLPTIPPEIIRPGNQKNSRFTLVWTGTPITYQFLFERKDALKLAAQNCDFELLIVGGDPAQKIPEVNCRYIPWSETAEADAIAQAHAGIMPLPDTPFARGKSAYKLICYLRAGIPGIASPVGENCRVIKHRQNGILAGRNEEWADAIKTLSNLQNYETFAAAALLDGKEFLLENAGKKLDDFLKSAFC